MPIRTPLTALLGIRHPILLAPMDVDRRAARLTPGGERCRRVRHSRRRLWRSRVARSRRPPSCKIAPSPSASASSPGASRSSRNCWTSRSTPIRARSCFRSAIPAPFAPTIKAAGALLICQVQSEEMARQALDAGADILIAQGTEAGGHGASRTTIDIVPAIVDLAAGRVPVVAAGGIADGRGLAAMMMLGASGVLLGTRFYASIEGDGAEEAKQRYCAANSGETASAASSSTVAQQLCGRRRSPARCLINDHVRRWTGREVELMQNVQTRSQPNMPRRRRPAISISPPSLPAKPSG